MQVAWSGDAPWDTLSSIDFLSMGRKSKGCSDTRAVTMAHLILSQVPVEPVDLVEGTDIQELVYEGYRKEVPPNIQKRPSPVKPGNVHNLHAMSTVNKANMPQAKFGEVSVVGSYAGAGSAG